MIIIYNNYSNDTQQIRNGLVNYIGSLLKASPYENKAARQSVTGCMLEESLKLAINEDESIDLYVAKPFLRATKIILEKKLNDLEALSIQIKNQEVVNKIDEYKNVINFLNTLINSIKE